MSDDTTSKALAEEGGVGGGERDAGAAGAAPSSIAGAAAAFLHPNTEKKDFDLIVIGSGPAAVGCAISSSRRG